MTTRIHWNFARLRFGTSSSIDEREMKSSTCKSSRIPAEITFFHIFSLLFVLSWLQIFSKKKTLIHFRLKTEEKKILNWNTLTQVDVQQKLKFNVIFFKWACCWISFFWFQRNVVVVVRAVVLAKSANIYLKLSVLYWSV